MPENTYQEVPVRSIPIGLAVMDLRGALSLLSRAVSEKQLSIIAEKRIKVIHSIDVYRVSLRDCRLTPDVIETWTTIGDSSLADAHIALQGSSAFLSSTVRAIE